MSAPHQSIVGNKLLSMLPLSNYEQVTFELDHVILPRGDLAGGNRTADRLGLEEFAHDAYGRPEQEYRRLTKGLFGDSQRHGPPERHRT